jgi:hypothetical protein
MKRQPLIISLTLLLALFLSGCEVIFTHAPAGKISTDKALIGSWIAQEKGKEVMTLKFDKGAGEEIRVSLLPADHDERNPLFTANIVTIANRSYLVLNPTNEDRDKGFLLARYEISGEELAIWIPNEEKFKTLIQQKKIIGESRSMGALVSDNPENLAKLFESKDIEDAFEVFGKFRRIRR